MPAAQSPKKCESMVVGVIVSIPKTSYVQLAWCLRSLRTVEVEREQTESEWFPASYVYGKILDFNRWHADMGMPKVRGFTKSFKWHISAGSKS